MPSKRKKKMKIKYIDASDLESSWLKAYRHIMTYDEKRQAYLSLVAIDHVAFDIPVDYDQSGERLISDGYKCLIYLPMTEFWCLSVFIDDKDEIIEWYFDMTIENGLDELGKPYFKDLYLDLALSSKGHVLVLDEDELKGSLDVGEITPKAYELAYKTLKFLKDHVTVDDLFMKDYLMDAYMELKNKIT